MPEELNRAFILSGTVDPRRLKRVLFLLNAPTVGYWLREWWTKQSLFYY